MWPDLPLSSAVALSVHLTEGVGTEKEPVSEEILRPDSGFRVNWLKCGEVGLTGCLSAPSSADWMKGAAKELREGEEAGPEEPPC